MMCTVPPMMTWSVRGRSGDTGKRTKPNEMMDSESDDLIFYTEYGRNCVKGVLPEPEENSDTSVPWIATMNIAGKEVDKITRQSMTRILNGR